MEKFKAGDRVKCVDVSDLKIKSIELGQIYTVSRAEHNKCFIYLEEFPGRFFYSCRFKPV